MLRGGGQQASEQLAAHPQQKKRAAHPHQKRNRAPRLAGPRPIGFRRPPAPSTHARFYHSLPAARSTHSKKAPAAKTKKTRRAPEAKKAPCTRNKSTNAPGTSSKKAPTTKKQTLLPGEQCGRCHEFVLTICLFSLRTTPCPKAFNKKSFETLNPKPQGLNPRP